MLAAAETGPIIPPWHNLFHPLEGLGYQFWSGIGSDFGQVTLVTASVVALYRLFRHLECHEVGCHKRGKYVIEGGVRCCDLHHPALDERPEDQRGHVHDLHQKHLALVASAQPAKLTASHE